MITAATPLPPDFLSRLAELETAYLAESDPIRQSGFGGGALRWEAERSSILDAVPDDGDFLDIGCANGYLLECLVGWARARGVTIDPFGLDAGAGLVALARSRFPSQTDHFFVGNAWTWAPPRLFRYVYSVHDCVPEPYLGLYVGRLLRRFVEAGGTLIIGAYGSRSEAIAVPPIDARLRSLGFRVIGRASGGQPAMAEFAWLAA